MDASNGLKDEGALEEKNNPAIPAPGDGPDSGGYSPKLSDENKQIADLLTELITTRKTWGFGQYFFVPAQCLGPLREPQTALSDLL